MMETIVSVVPADLVQSDQNHDFTVHIGDTVYIENEGQLWMVSVQLSSMGWASG